MITTGIIKGKYSDKNNTTIYQVDLGIFKNAGVVSEINSTLFNCTAIASPGTYDMYKENDLVYVGFVNNQYHYPVILGLIYKHLPDEDEVGYTYRLLDRLKVSGSTELSPNTKIGDISYSDLVELQSQVTVMDAFVDTLTKGDKDTFLHKNENTGELEWTSLGTQSDLIWTNNSMDSTIVSLAIDLSKYNFVIITFYNTHNIQTETKVVKVGDSTTAFMFVNTSSLEYISREVHTNTSGISLSANSVVTDISQGNTTTSTDYFIPKSIYGV